MRLALAQALFCQPDMLLLDEPTNMLDFPAVVWLEGYLLDWSGTVVTVSHDRYFLDAIATDIFHLHNETIDAYRGNYQSFLTSKEDRLKAQQTEYEAQQQQRAHLQAFIDRWRYNANRAAQAQSRIKILEKMPVLRPIVKDVAIVFRLPPVDHIGSPLVTMEDVSFSYAPSVTHNEGDISDDDGVARRSKWMSSKNHRVTSCYWIQYQYP